jgi:hypothetical protein
MSGAFVLPAAGLVINMTLELEIVIWLDYVIATACLMKALRHRTIHSKTCQSWTLNR